MFGKKYFFSDELLIINCYIFVRAFATVSVRKRFCAWNFIYFETNNIFFIPWLTWTKFNHYIQNFGTKIRDKTSGRELNRASFLFCQKFCPAALFFLRALISYHKYFKFFNLTGLPWKLLWIDRRVTHTMLSYRLLIFQKKKNTR